jgi:phenylalanyl-tRNA synthetase beta chain
MVLVSYDWLKDFVDLPESPDEVAEILISLGMEVESLTRYEAPLEKVEVVQITQVNPHPNADRLSVCQVATSKGEFPVVCGAPNVRVGMKTAWAPPGLTLPGGFDVSVATIRGQESYGMLCSEMEMGLTKESEGILEMDADHEVGRPVSQYLPASDAVFELEVTINRPDLMSHYGVARDLAVKLRRPLRRPIPEFKESERLASGRIKVTIKDPDLGPRYSARVVEGVQIKASPVRMRQRLERCGVRAISNVVDVTNYVMLEYGHPLHAFDMRFVEGNEIIVQRAKPGEKFITLDEKEHELDSEMLLIRDGVKGVALAGVMGGMNSEIRDDTTEVLIECAYFNPVSIRKTSKRLGIATESSRRFERGMDPEAPLWVIDRTAQLMQAISGGEILKGVVDEYPVPVSPLKVGLRPDRVKIVTSLEVPKVDMERILTGLGCQSAVIANEAKRSYEIIEVTMPSWRPDLEREVDLIEEVARVWGYDRIVPQSQSFVNLAFKQDPKEQFISGLRTAWSAFGFSEILTNAMVPVRLLTDSNREGIPIKNPVTDEMTHLRSDLLGGLLDAVRYNRNRGIKGMRMFEVGKVFWREESEVREGLELAGVVYGIRNPLNWQEGDVKSDYYDIKGAIEMFLEKFSLDNPEFFYYDSTADHPLRVEVRCQVYSLGIFGIVSPVVCQRFDLPEETYYFRFDVERLQSCMLEHRHIKELPRFPSAMLDLSFVIDRSRSAQDLEDAVRQYGGENLVGVEIFDVYEGDRLPSDKKGIAVRLEFRARDRTLVDSEIREFQNTIIAGVEKEIQAVLRS